MPYRRFLCENPAEPGYGFPEWQGFAYTAWAYSYQSEWRVDVVWVRCEMVADDVWVTNWILTEADTLEFRRLARLAKSFRGFFESGEEC